MMPEAKTGSGSTIKPVNTKQPFSSVSFLNLPLEVLLRIFEKTSKKDWWSLLAVNSLTRQVALFLLFKENASHLWRLIFFKKSRRFIQKRLPDLLTKALPAHQETLTLNWFFQLFSPTRLLLESPPGLTTSPPGFFSKQSMHHSDHPMLFEIFLMHQLGQKFKATKHTSFAAKKRQQQEAARLMIEWSLGVASSTDDRSDTQRLTWAARALSLIPHSEVPKAKSALYLKLFKKDFLKELPAAAAFFLLLQLYPFIDFEEAEQLTRVFISESPHPKIISDFKAAKDLNALILVMRKFLLLKQFKEKEVVIYPHASYPPNHLIENLDSLLQATIEKRNQTRALRLIEQNNEQLSDAQRNHAFIQAILKSLPDVTLSLLTRNVEIVQLRDPQGMTPLMLSASAGLRKTTSLLIVAGANLNEQSPEGNTALMLAILHNRRMVTTQLIQADADVNQQNNDGDTPLILAARLGHNKIAFALIEANADLDSQNNEGDTALISLAKHNNLALAEKLLNRGANINLENKKGYTALTLALLNNHQALIRLLLSKNGQLRSTHSELTPNTFNFGKNKPLLKSIGKLDRKKRLKDARNLLFGLYANKAINPELARIYTERVMHRFEKKFSTTQENARFTLQKYIQKIKLAPNLLALRMIVWDASLKSLEIDHQIVAEKLLSATKEKKQPFVTHILTRHFSHTDLIKEIPSKLFLPRVLMLSFLHDLFRYQLTIEPDYKKLLNASSGSVEISNTFLHHLKQSLNPPFSEHEEEAIVNALLQILEIAYSEKLNENKTYLDVLRSEKSIYQALLSVFKHQQSLTSPDLSALALNSEAFKLFWEGAHQPHTDSHQAVSKVLTPAPIQPTFLPHFHFGHHPEDEAKRSSSYSTSRVKNEALSV